ncbi:hypothetical protein HHI36_020599 [Cryptolaemus montrouzieri]|uniref:Methuselah N-terminal domain-containing protein n=1 Tax=Cryptolaemus montrouzieri TaxID=559131 RepID=A0ABD2NB64_9CUCU
MFKSIVILVFLSVVLGKNVKIFHTNDDYSICGSERCVRKCCPENLIYFQKKCINHTTIDFPLTIFDGEKERPPSDITFHLIHDKHCEVGYNVRLVPNFFPEDKFYVQADGKLFLPFLEEFVPFNLYCMENIKLKANDTTVEFSVLRCDDTIVLGDPAEKVYSQVNVMKGLILVLLSFVSKIVSNSPCLKSLSVNITNGVKNDDYITKDGFIYNSSNYYYENDLIYGCPCNFKKCIRKCCGVDEIMINRTCTKSDIEVKIPIHRNTDFIYHLDMRNETYKKLDYFYIHEMCKKGARLSPELYPDTDNFYIQEDGKFFAPDAEIGGMLDVGNYCVDVFYDEEIDRKFAAIFCYVDVDTEQTIQNHVYSAGEFCD